MNFFVAFYRIIRFALQSFWRNIWLSVITVTILVLTLGIINILLVLNVVGQTAVTSVQSKIDVSVSFVPKTTDETMAAVRGYLQGLPQVKDARYVAPEDVLKEFKLANANKPEVLASLDEVGGNPFGGQVIITANNPADFAFILQALDNPQFKSSIQEKDYQDHQAIISSINQTIDQVRIGGIVLGSLFILITILIVVNTIRVAIYTHREEIGIMRLVGASSMFIRAPFLFEAILYTLIALVIATGILYPLLGLVEPYLDNFFVNNPVQLIHYFNQNFLIIFGAEFIGLAALNMISTVFAMRRYLRV